MYKPSARSWSNEALTSVRSMCRIGGLLPMFVILMAIAGPCSNSPIAPSFHADARWAASGVEDDSIAALSPMKAHEEHQSGHVHSGVPHGPTPCPSATTH